MHFVKLDTSDHACHWVNLYQVSRVTIGTDESGVDVLVAVFSDGDLQNSLTIRGTDEVNRQAIAKTGTRTESPQRVAGFGKQITFLDGGVSLCERKSRRVVVVQSHLPFVVVEVGRKLL